MADHVFAMPRSCFFERVHKTETGCPRGRISAHGAVPKWLREGSAKPSFSSSNLLGASIVLTP